jgi:glycosyltransferase involved in cell wall biosynthesis
MKVLFLISDGFGIGGTIRTTFNLAGVLASRGHDVEVLSSFRRRDAPQMPVDPAVRLMSLLEVRKDHPDYDATDPLRGRPAVVYPRDDYRAGDYDLLAEDRCARYLRDCDADVVIGTRPGLIAWISRFAPERMIRIGQEHLTRTMHRKGLRTAMAPHYRRLDAFVTVSARDAEDYRERLNLPDTRLLFIPNSVPSPQVPPSDGRQKLVVAAGRLVASKRYDVLVRAFAKVVAEHPDWRLRVYGGGVENTEIRRLVVELGLHNHVLMMGGYSPIEPEWAKGAVAAVPSDKEPFGMTLVEAMRCGLPVVSTDAPYGPAEILADGQDGLLTPVGNPDAMADALLRVIGDGERRRSMAAAALANSARYDPEPVADRYEELFAELAADKARRRRTGGWRRTLSRLRGHTTGVRTPTGPPATVLGPAASSTRPTADCTITGDGDVVLRLLAAALPAEPALVWRRVGTRGGTVPVPMPVRDGDALTVTVFGGDVPEGAWELHLAGSGDHPDPVMAGLRDTRALLDAAGWDFGAPDRDGVQVRLPYRSSAGVFGLRVWRRGVHPEVGDVQVCDGELQFGGRLVGAPFGTGEPVLELRRRTPEKLTERVAVRRVGPTGFRVTVPVESLAVHRPADQDMWDMWLRYDETATPVRLGRFLDDVVNKHTAYVYPDVVVPQPGPGAAEQTVRVQPCYTAQNEFSVRVTALSA